MILIENLDLKSLAYIFINKNKLKKKYGLNISFIYQKKIIFYFFKIIFTLLGFKIKILRFKLKDIRSSKGELISLKILRDDLFLIERNILYEISNSKLLKEEIDEIKKDYISKSILTESINKKLSLWRLIFLINVFDYKFDNINKLFILNQRPWGKIITNYSNEFDIKIKFLKLSFFVYFFNYNKTKKLVKKILKKFYNNFNYYNNNHYKKIINNNINKIFCESYGQVNLSNAKKSDFFWLINSDFSIKNVFCNVINLADHDYLNKHNINHSYNFKFNSISNNKKYKYSNDLISNNKNKKDKEYLDNSINEYEHNKNIWIDYYKKFKIKTILSWYKYDSSHLYKHEAIQQVGGISCLWQFAFYGNEYYDIKSYADINFTYSAFSANIYKKINSKFNYQIITGLPTYKLEPKIYEQAKLIKKNIQYAGARKIICVFDENSADDDRFHTGHDYQKQIYELMLTELLLNKELGIIFKPKVYFNLKKRLGSINILLEEALKTNRCYIFSDHITRSTSTPPLVAALSSDLVIHTDLSAGTAAIECAQKEIPTILIDRETAIASKLNELPKNKIVFGNLESAIDAINKHFYSKSTIDGFGDWSNFINEFDPFNDNNGALRIGNYLKSIIDGYDKGMSREDILSSAAEQYSKRWGSDKIMY